MKRNLKLIIIVLSVVSFLFLCYKAWWEIPRLSYTYRSEYDGYLVNVAYGNLKSYTVPSTHRGKNVVGIASRAFNKHSNLESITFENAENIVIIERLAFNECKKLKEIDLSTVDTIERNAFAYDVSLKELVIGAEDIGASAFYGCTSLATVTFEDGLNSIGSMAFAGSRIMDLYLPDSVSMLYADCFYDMKFLVRISAPSYVSGDTDYIATLTNYIRRSE